MPKKYSIITFGCQANHSDSERIAGVLEKSGLKKAKNEKESDVLIFNSCSVRQSAEDRIFGLNKKLKDLKIKNSKLKIALTGCMLHYSTKELKKRLPHIDIFLPIKEIGKIPRQLENSASGRKPGFRLSDYLSFAPKYESGFRAYVPISSGCDNFCSYCIVPYSRGKERNRPTEEIISEVKDLVKRGYKEIWLLGQNVNGWQCKQSYLLKNNFPEHAPLLKNKLMNPLPARAFRKAVFQRFPDLLRIINGIPGNFWLRFTSPHPKNFSDALIKTMAECGKFPHYLNLPAQSGDNEILKKMNRPYTRGHYIKLVKKIRKEMPDAAISTDIIVGFPGETEKQFQNTVKLFKEIKFDMAYVSEYSERPSTLAAAKFKDDIPQREKARRKKYLTEILAKTALRNNKKLEGKTVDVLIDEKKNGRLFGRTKGNKVVEIDSRGSAKIGEFSKVKITQAESWKLKGALLK